MCEPAHDHLGAWLRSKLADRGGRAHKDWPGVQKEPLWKFRGWLPAHLDPRSLPPRRSPVTLSLPRSTLIGRRATGTHLGAHGKWLVTPRMEKRTTGAHPPLSVSCSFGPSLSAACSRPCPLCLVATAHFKSFPNSDGFHRGWGDEGVVSFTLEVGNSRDGFWPKPDRIEPIAEQSLWPATYLLDASGPMIQVSSRRGGFGRAAYVGHDTGSPMSLMLGVSGLPPSVWCKVDTPLPCPYYCACQRSLLPA